MEPPIEPQVSDCCNSGCNPCIFDVYEEQLKKYVTKFEHQDEIYCNRKNCIFPSSYSVFKLDNECEKQLKYKPGQHFLLKGYDLSSGVEFTKAYTPIPYGENSKRSFTILVRMYNNGKMCSYLHNLQIGDETLWRGPYCNFNINYSMKNILFIAQGTGIAPIYSILKEMLNNDSCETFLHLFFCCRSFDDIFLRNELYVLKAHWNFNYEVFLKSSSNIWNKYEEIIHERKLKSEDLNAFIMNKNKKDLQVIICGSEEFENCINCYLQGYGIKDNNIFKFD
ncbi:NADH-cytochrome b5 reductase-like [Harmonia axyridis]|uniref:NADH-cytochrome b5 reductase-like n=1 Tax=Harmonia axyridis TaxID=115357 RepID=UPI001E275803|nr:NADH-cytochrome b5 reductase-like [Harmonia axyridis]